MRILVVSQYFYPENFRINHLCLELKKRGHQITVLTGKPNYPKGEYFEGYSFKGNEDEIWNGIPILRVPLRARKSGGLGLIRNYLSFVFNANRKAKKLKNEFDLIYVFEVSPVTVALPAIKLKKRFNIPIVMNVQDLWPENIVAVTGIKSKIVISTIDRMVKYIYKNCDCILCASPSFVSKIQSKIDKVNTAKVKYWPQYSLVGKSEEKNEVYDCSKFNITFTGNIGEAQGIDIAIQAANNLRDTNIHWHFVGDGRNRKKLEVLVKRMNLNKQITFHGLVKENEVPKYLASSSAALLILKPNPVFEMTIPAKLQTYLSCGTPIIGCVSGEAKKIIEEANCGIVSDEISAISLEKVCRKMISLTEKEMDMYKSNSVRYGMDNFNKTNLVNLLEKYMEDVLYE